MSSAPSKDELITLLRSSGACAVGFTRCEEVSPTFQKQYLDFIAAGRHGNMSYLERNIDLRFDPAKLFPGCRTVISLAYCYRRQNHHPLFADYALSEDYHRAIPRTIHRALSNSGLEYRVCTDSAPVAERYWAVKSGIGFVGRNNMLIVPGVGSKVLLAEILTTQEYRPDSPNTADCGNCGACIRQCPGKALDGKDMDCTRCLAYLTIESPDDPEAEIVRIKKIFGCDICQDMCPHNRSEAPCAPCLEPMPKIMATNSVNLNDLSLRHTAMARAGKDRLLKFNKIAF